MCYHNMMDATGTYVVYIVVDKPNTCCDRCLNHQEDYVDEQYTIGTVIMYWQFPQLKSCLWFWGTVNLLPGPVSYILSLGISSSLRIWVFLDATLCHWVMKMKALHFFAVSGATDPWHSITSHKTWILSPHCCENVKFCTRVSSAQGMVSIFSWYLDIHFCPRHYVMQESPKNSIALTAVALCYRMKAQVMKI